MLRPNFKEFVRKSGKANLIPVWKKLPVGKETPPTVFSKIDDGKHGFLLESTGRDKHLSRYSYVGSAPSVIFKIKSGRAEIIKNGRKTTCSVSDPYKMLREFLFSYKPAVDKNLPIFFGGLVGYLGYDLALHTHGLTASNPDELGLPDALLFFVDNFIIFDHITNKLILLALARVDSDPREAYKQAVRKIGLLEQRLGRLSKKRMKAKPEKTKVSFQCNLGKEEFMCMVKEIKGYIKRNIVRQVIVSRRLETRIKVDPLSIYTVLRQINPSPYMFYLSCGDFKLIGASPENLIKLEGSRVETRPVASTHPRGKTAKEDQELMGSLITSPKEISEHMMLFDLCKEELTQVCEPGSVRAGGIITIEKYSHVMHLVSTIRAILREDKDSFDLLRTCFPSATISGVPKRKAVELIEEVEPTRRGPYTGSIGYISPAGDLDFGIIVRSIIVKGDRAYIPVGCGIVAQSDPDSEYRETAYKAQAQLEAIELAKV